MTSFPSSFGQSNLLDTYKKGSPALDNTGTLSTPSAIDKKLKSIQSKDKSPISKKLEDQTPSWRTVLKVLGVFALIFGAAGGVLLTSKATSIHNGADLKENTIKPKDLIDRFQPLSEGICNIRPLMDKCKIETYPDSFSIDCPFLGFGGNDRVKLRAFFEDIKEDLSEGDGYLDCDHFRYKGHWKDGKQEGFGVYSSEGYQYQGEWKQGEYHGKGMYLGEGGNTFEGEFRDGSEYTGIGTVFLPNGKGRYEGEWKFGNYDGNGTLFLSNGYRYRGEWQQGKANGNGIFFSQNGFRVKGVWKNHKLDGPVEVRLWEEDDKPCHINVEEGNPDVMDLGFCFFKTLVSKNMFKLANFVYQNSLQYFSN